MLFVINVSAQSRRTSNSGSSSRTEKRGTQKDSTNVTPRGLKTWSIDERFGTVTPTIPDTVTHLFQNTNLTDGFTGSYNHTGNLGSPRVSRIYDGQQDFMMANQFIFMKPYGMAIGSVADCIYTNTKSPITNLTWMSQGNKLNGDDRLRANFATNINKDAGVGFKVDYLFGRGYFSHQQQSSVAAKIFGSYRGERYSMHAAYILDRTKNAENGGLADETYITHPEIFSTKYQMADMPVRLSSAFNRLKVNTIYLTHRYNLGYYQLIDSVANDSVAMEELSIAPDSLRKIVPDSLRKLGPRKFTPVAGIIHTVKFDHNRRFYIDNSSNRSFYIDDFFPENDTINDQTRYLSIENTVALEMSEGFKKWVKTGMRLFFKHQLTRFNLPDLERQMQGTTYNYITLGGQLFRNQGDIFHYNVLGEIRTTGVDWGEFNVEGDINFNIPIRRDTVTLRVNGYVRNEEPSYYYRHYHSANAWWDNDLSKVFRARAEGMLSWRKTRLKVGIETIQNHLFFQEHQQWPETSTAPAEGDFSNVKYGLSVAQAKKNVQLLSATLCQDFKLGPVVWENELTYQQTSDNKVLPLPVFTGWSNLYLHFKIAKVLSTDIGGDVRYFTKYYAPAYSPMIGQYVVQDETYRTKVGNYPWVNVYANFHLKSCRFYVMFSHVNCTAGNYFLTPHYPTNQRAFRIGISWNFFN